VNIIKTVFTLIIRIECTVQPCQMCMHVLSSMVLSGVMFLWSVLHFTATDSQTVTPSSNRHSIMKVATVRRIMQKIIRTAISLTYAQI